MTPTRPAPPPPPANGTSPSPRTPRTFSISSGVQRKAHRIGIYGTGGIGKTTLASLIGQVGIEPIFVDLERGSEDVDVKRIQGIETFDDLRDALHSEQLFPTGAAAVIDTATTAEMLAVKWTLENVPHEKGKKVDSVEGYGFGKGYQHVYETFLKFLGDMDNLHRRGVNTIMIMHDCTTPVPNPTGDDWIRYEPRLQSPSSGKSSIRAAVKEWLDHLLFIGYDVAVSDDGKGQGVGTRTIYPQEMPTHIAKSRTLREPIAYTEHDAVVWRQLFGKE